MILPALQEVGGSLCKSLSSFKILLEAISAKFLYLKLNGKNGGNGMNIGTWKRGFGMIYKLAGWLACLRGHAFANAIWGV